MTVKTDTKVNKRDRRHGRIRSKVKGTSDRPRLSVFRSNKYVHVQVIDDKSGKTLFGLVSKGIEGKSGLERSKEAGKRIGAEIKKKGIEQVVFDRGGFAYTGHIREVAEGAREAGLKF